MNKYRNIKTGAIIRTTGVVGGKNWVPVEEPEQPPVEETPAENPFIEETSEEETVQEETPAENPFIEETSEEETVQEEAPAEKPKATRRGKK